MASIGSDFDHSESIDYDLIPGDEEAKFVVPYLSVGYRRNPHMIHCPSHGEGNPWHLRKMVSDHRLRRLEGAIIEDLESARGDRRYETGLDVTLW